MPLSKLALLDGRLALEPARIQNFHVNFNQRSLSYIELLIKHTPSKCDLKVYLAFHVFLNETFADTRS